VAFPVGSVANYFLDLADQDGVAVSPMKLQKLVYLAHGWHWAIADAPLLDEVVEAWKFGPVVPSLYHEFKRFGAGRIEGERFRKVEHSRNGGWTLVPCEMPDDTDEATLARALIERVWEVYREYTGVQLSNLTHQAGTPWQKTWDGMGERKRKGKDIDEDMIRDHFKQLAGTAS